MIYKLIIHIKRNKVLTKYLIEYYFFIQMEPMTLGSPAGSPMQSPGSPGTSAYLPSFLLGDTTTVSKIYYHIIYIYNIIKNYF